MVITMFRNDKLKDLSEDEFINIVTPHSELCYEFNINFIIPEYIAFYLASGYYHDALWENSLLTHITDALNNFNVDIDDMYSLILQIKKLLKTKYNLEVISEEPIFQVKSYL